MKNLSVQQWKQELSAMKAVEIDTVIIQWSQYDLYPFYGKGTDHKDNLIGRLMTAADDLNIKVFLGTIFDSTWVSEWAWKDVAYLKSSLANNRSFLPNIWSMYKDHKSFVGWYIPQEIADWDYRDLSIFAPELYNLRYYYKSIVDICKSLDENMKVGLSAFFVGKFTPNYVEYSFREMLEGTRLDVLMVQIGYGVRHWRSIKEFVVPYFKAFNYAAEANNIELWAVQEMFDLEVISNGFDETTIKIEPLSIDILKKRQKEILPITNNLVYFDFFHYLSPERGKIQEKNYRTLFSEKILADRLAIDCKEENETNSFQYIFKPNKNDSYELEETYVDGDYLERNSYAVKVKISDDDQYLVFFNSCNEIIARVDPLTLIIYP